MADGNRPRRTGRGAGGGLFPAGYEQATRSERDGAADGVVPAEQDPTVYDDRTAYEDPAGYGDRGYAAYPDMDADAVGNAYPDGPHQLSAHEDRADTGPIPVTGAHPDEAYLAAHQTGEHPALDDGYADGPYVEGGHPDEPYVEGAYVDEPYVDEPYVDEAYVDGAYADEDYVDGAYVDGAYADDEYADDDDGYWYEGNHPVRHRAASVSRRHPVLVGFLALVLIVVLVVGAGILWASRQINPGGHPGADVTVRIPSDSSSAQIGSDLAKAGVIHGGSLFRYYVRIQGSGPLLSGTYVLPKNESYDSAIAALEKGPALVTDKLVIPEGFTLREVAARVAALPGMHLSASKFLALSSSGSVRSPFEPKGTNDLEGLVYAATYPILRTDSESDILEEMVGSFNTQMHLLGLQAGATKLHMTPYQLITVASIIQGEAKDSSQFADTASVIYNRLASGMTLGTDSTLVYALRQKDPDLNINKVDYEEPSPYNTRLNKGLPPTPIDNPSLPALKAAIDPAHTSYEYFVEVKQDGTLGFASNNAGFAQLENECRANGLDC